MSPILNLPSRPNPLVRGTQDIIFNRKLGQGAFGQVFQIQIKGLPGKFAIKMVIFTRSSSVCSTDSTGKTWKRRSRSTGDCSTRASSGCWTSSRRPRRSTWCWNLCRKATSFASCLDRAVLRPVFEGRSFATPWRVLPICTAMVWFFAT